MKTPKLYNNLFNEKKITNEIIAECVYSVNKRAKNYRDKINEYKKEDWLKKDKKTEKIEEVKEMSLTLTEDKSIWNKIKKFIKNIFNK